MIDRPTDAFDAYSEDDAAEPAGVTPDVATATATAIQPADPAPAPSVRRERGGASPDADLRVAHTQLRSGNVLPARVHLETLAGRRQLDAPGLLDLAESRWRTGDLPGAGEAVLAYLEAGGDTPLGYLIAAEATSAVGRPGEARKLARRALETITLPLDAVFAGQSRSSVWPHDPSAPVQPAGTLFAPVPNDATHGGRIGLTADPRPTTPAPAAAAAVNAATTATPAPSAEAAPPASPDEPAEPVAPLAEAQPERTVWDVGQDAIPPDAQRELDEARAALAIDDRRTAAVHLAVVLRLRPALAPAVLDLVGQLPGADFDLVRGDALRLVGHEAAAERAFAAAADSLRQSASSRSSE